MKSRFCNRARKNLRRMLRGSLALALAAKFLVPVGYMPSAFADGGPITLCNALPGIATAESPHADPVTQADAADAAPSAHAHPSSDGEHAAHAAADPSDAAAAGGHDHDSPSASHHDWERCSLGGLASLAAMAGDWHFALPHPGAERIIVEHGATIGRETRVAFRSRAPPPAHA